jgi:hypothetical protein
LTTTRMITVLISYLVSVLPCQLIEPYLIRPHHLCVGFHLDMLYWGTVVKWRVFQMRLAPWLHIGGLES